MACCKGLCVTSSACSVVDYIVMKRPVVGSLKCNYDAAIFARDVRLFNPIVGFICSYYELCTQIII